MKKVLVAVSLASVLGCGGGSPSEGLVDTWQTALFPQSDTGEFVFKGNGHFTSAFNEGALTLSEGTYSFDGTTLTLDYAFSTNASLIGTQDNFTITLSDTEFTAQATTFLKVEADTDIVSTWQSALFPQSDTGEFVFKNDGHFTSVFNEASITLSEGTYTFDGSTLGLDFAFSTNGALIGTQENHSASITATTLTVSAVDFGRVE